MSAIIKFGEDIDGYSVPVLNEREIRASAGILFLAMFLALMYIVFEENFLLIKYVIVIFLTDFIIRIFINPRYAPTLIIGRLIVSNQVPEYVGAPPKKFAWVIGFVLASIMFILMVVVNSYSPITGIICLICLVFLFFESVFGICLGCKFYPVFFKERAQYCPGNVCDINAKQDIQKTSGTQIFIVLGFVLYITITIYFFNNSFSKAPYDMFGINKTGQTQLK
jgi:hypothetical protein